MTLKQTTEYYSNASPALVEEDSSLEGKPSHDEHIDITREVAEEDKHLVQPAGVGAAIVGSLFFGPILGALLGFSAAYGVRKQNGAGNLARAVGELASSVQSTTDKIEEKYHFGENTTEAINEFCDKSGDKSIPYKTREFLVSTWLEIAGFTKEKQLLENGVEGTGKGIEAIGRAFDRLLGKTPKPDEDLVFVAEEAPVEISNDHRHYTELVPVVVKTH